MRKTVIDLRVFYVVMLFASVIDLALPHPIAYACDPVTLIMAGIQLMPYTKGWSMGLAGHLFYKVTRPKPPAPIDRGKLDDIRISLPGYGESIIKAWGTFRAAPIWFWHTPIVHTTVTTPGRSGGKGAPKPPTPDTIDHIYTTSLAGVFHDGPISSVRRIWFDNDLVYNTVTSGISPLSAIKYEAEAATLAGGAAAVSSSACSGGQRVQGIGSGGTVSFAVNADATINYEIGVYYTSTIDKTFKVSVNGGANVDLVCPASGGANVVAIQTITVALTSGANTILFSNAGAAAPDLDKLEVAPEINIDPLDPIDDRRFTGLVDPNMVPATDQDISWPYYNARPAVNAQGVYSTNLGKYGQPSIRIYSGTETQTADPAIVADKGASNAPAYRGYSYLVIEGLQLQAGRIPNVTVEVDQGTTDVDQIVEDLYGLVGIGSSSLTVTALSSDTLTGLLITSRRAAADVISELQTRFQFDLPEVDGKVKAVKRSGSSDLTIPYAELRAHLDGEEMPAFDALITDIDPLLLPGRVDLNYLDPEMDYHNNVQSAMRLVGSHYDNQTASLSIVDSADNMKKLATVLLYKPDLEGRSFRFATGPKYMRVHPGSVVTLPLPNATHVVRVTEAKYQLPAGVCEFEGVRQQASIYSPTGTGSVSSGYEAPIAPVVSNTKGVFIDGPVVDPENAGDSSQPLVYAGMSGRGSGAWSGGFLYKEHPHGSDNYILITAADKPAGIGITSNTLASVDDTESLDTSSSIVVEFYSNVQLSSATEAELLANPKLNLIAVINPSTSEAEYVQFKTATAGVAAVPFISKYTLTNLFRGRFETDEYVGVHTSADEVVVMDSALKVIPMPVADVGVERNYKFVSSGQSVDDAIVTPFTWVATALRPHKPTDLITLKDGYGDHQILFNLNPRPIEEPAQGEVEITTSGGVHKRYLPVTKGTSVAALLHSSASPTGLIIGPTGDALSSHATKNNLISPIDIDDTASAISLFEMVNTALRFNCEIKWLGSNGSNIETDTSSVGLIARVGLQPLASAEDLGDIDFDLCPIMVEWGQGATGPVIEETYKSFGVALASRDKVDPGYASTSEYNSGRPGPRYSFQLIGTEYRLYRSGLVGNIPNTGQAPVAVVSAPSAGFPFPLRVVMECRASDERIGIINQTFTGDMYSTIYSVANQIADFGATQPRIYGKAYQKTRFAGLPDGFPVEFSGGAALRITEGGDYRITEAGDSRITES